MTIDDTLDEKIRTSVLVLVDSAPPAPVLKLDALPEDRAPRWTLSHSFVLAGLAVVVAVVVVAALLVAPGSSQEVSEAELGLRLASQVATTQPVPPGQVPVATGTVFGHPWLVSGLNPSGGRPCIGFSYRESILFYGGCGINRYKIPTPPTWARSAFSASLGTASDGQRFLVAATNGTVTRLTVSAKGGTYVTASPLAKRLGNATFFVLSLGRERGPCYTLCQGSVTLSVSTNSGPTLINDAPYLVIHDYGGVSAALSAPERK